MKKVGIVSCYFKNNYGSMLQAYATKKILDNNNIPNETINIDYNEDFKKGKRKYYATQLFNYKFIKNKSGMIKMKFQKKINRELGKNIEQRNKKYKEFRNKINLSRSNNTYVDLTKQAEEKYTDVIVGSDQLWLPVNVIADYYTLNWVPDNVNKISYSTSFGFSEIPEKYNEIYRKFLNRINHLSTREESGVKIIKKIINKDAKLVCDPTILLTKEEWKNEIDTKPIYNEKYILCYFLGNNIEHRKFAERLRKKTGCKIISLNHSDEYVKYSDTFCDYAPYNIGPEEWINLIMNAEYVCTDSFHGTVFSILFNKKFFDFRRHNNKSKVSTNSRIDSLLDVAGINKQRILTGSENIDDVLKYEIDYDTVNKNISNFREESKKWLLDSITWSDNELKHVDVSNKEDCCGCTACMNICPVKAIKMIDDEGFKYPKVNEEICIKCGKCKKACPIINKQKFNDFIPKAYLFQNKNEKIRMNSTSGGFYSAIGKYVIEQDGIVYGVAFNENWVAIHQRATTIQEINKFRRSKYVQSDLNQTFKKVENDLKSSKMVLFSGTPCQVAGLKQYLGREYDNLITLDFVCRAVPSPLFFEKYKEYILKKYKGKAIKDIDFRDKTKCGYSHSEMKVEMDNYTYRKGIDVDPYLRGFFTGEMIRPSCERCNFKTINRVSDFTIWDCLNINEVDKKFDDNKGTTRILAHTQKGNELINKLESVRIEQIGYEKCLKGVKEITKSTKFNPRSKYTLSHINDEDFIEKEYPIKLKMILKDKTRIILVKTGVYNKTKTAIKKILRRV